jgi:hypothetical protein
MPWRISLGENSIVTTYFINQTENFYNIGLIRNIKNLSIWKFNKMNQYYESLFKWSELKKSLLNHDDYARRKS